MAVSSRCCFLFPSNIQLHRSLTFDTTFPRAEFFDRDPNKLAAAARVGLLIRLDDDIDQFADLRFYYLAKTPHAATVNAEKLPQHVGVPPTITAASDVLKERPHGIE